MPKSSFPKAFRHEIVNEMSQEDVFNEMKSRYGNLRKHDINFDNILTEKQIKMRQRLRKKLAERQTTNEKNA